MNDKRVRRYEDLQVLVQMLQLAKQRAEHLQEAERLTAELARLRARCNPELRSTLDRLTLIDEYRANLGFAHYSSSSITRN